MPKIKKITQPTINKKLQKEKKHKSLIYKKLLFHKTPENS